jgi:hypothetical protein
MATSSVAAPGDTADADYLLGGDTLLRVYEQADDGSTVLLGHHRQVTAEENAADGKVSVAATFADPVWTLMRRLIGKTVGGYARGTALAPVDPATIIFELLAAANADSPTGVVAGDSAASTPTYVADWRFKPLGEAVSDLGATLGGPDWRVRPTEWTFGSYGALDVLPIIGTARTDAAFEYGDGLLNVASYKRAVTVEGGANRLYSLPVGFPDNAANSVLSRQDTGSQAIRGVLEAVVAGDLTVDVLRAALLDHHLAIRANPRQIISFQPVRDTRAGRLPRFGVDYGIGDVLPFRASIRRRDGVLVKRLDVTARLYNYGVSVDELGAGTPTLTMSPA